MLTQNGFFQIALYLVVIVIAMKPLGLYMARVYENKSTFMTVIVGPLERLIYRLCGVNTTQEMGWKTYLSSMLFLNLIGILFVYLIQRCQGLLPLNPQAFSAVASDLSFNTAASFVTNTNWQAYAGESSLSYLTQMMGLTVQNFLSAATGMSLLVALIRGLVRHESNNLGNFWVDLVRGILYILLPLSTLLALLIAGQGVIQNFHGYQKVTLLQPQTYQQNTNSLTVTEQEIPMGPVASQVAIKQLGSNGGGFFNANSAHPFENPTPLSNFLEMIAILLIPASLCYTFGVMVNDRKQGWAIFIAMLIMFVPVVFFATTIELHGNPAIAAQGVIGGNMEGKETRFGIVNSTLWAIATTATSNGSVNAMQDSFMPLAGLLPLWMMHLGEVVFGGVGSGLYGMLMLVVMTVFVAGLMVGRTPEYLGKKIEPYEMKMASVAVLIMPLVVLLLTAVGAVTEAGTSALLNTGPHGFTELLYAFTSMGNNNGSAFAGINANTPYFNVIGGIEMLMLRFWIAIPTLAVAGSLVRKKTIPNSAGTLPTHSLLFIFLLIAITVIIGALTFFPALALGPIVEHLILWGKYGH